MDWLCCFIWECKDFLLLFLLGIDVDVGVDNPHVALLYGDKRVVLEKELRVHLVWIAVKIDNLCVVEHDDVLAVLRVFVGHEWLAAGCNHVWAVSAKLNLVDGERNILGRYV